MRELACNSGQVPPRYQVKPGTLSVDGGVIASGNFSDLRRGKLDGKTVAVKTLKPHQGNNPRDVQKVRFVSKHFFQGTLINMAENQNFCKECIIWMSVSHQNLLRLIAVDINIDPSPPQYSMISEMKKGNIKDFIRENSVNRLRLVRMPLNCATDHRLTLNLLSAQLTDAATGLHYLHERGIVHGDLKGVRLPPYHLFCVITAFPEQHLNCRRNPS